MTTNPRIIDEWGQNLMWSSFSRGALLSSNLREILIFVLIWHGMNHRPFRICSKSWSTPPAWRALNLQTWPNPGGQGAQGSLGLPPINYPLATPPRIHPCFKYRAGYTSNNYQSWGTAFWLDFGGPYRIWVVINAHGHTPYAMHVLWCMHCIVNQNIPHKKLMLK